MTLLPAAAGALLLLVLAIDVFVTVFHPEGHGGPLTRRAGRLLWAGWRAVAPRSDARDGWLALGGPMLALLAPALWALLLVGGFALVYYPWIEGFLVSPGFLRAPWTEVLYYSGFTAATLGTGDVVPDLPALRLLTILEALGGFALLSASLSYILAIYRENGRKTTLAADLALHYDAQPGAERRGLGGQRDRWLEEVAGELLHVRLAHAQYPILHYFRPAERSSSLALQLGPLVRRGAGGDAGGAGADDPPAPGRVLVAAALERYLEAADKRFVRAGGDEPEGDSTEGRYLRLLDYLGYAPSDAGPVGYATSGVGPPGSPQVGAAQQLRVDGDDHRAE